ncbi:STM2901 family protein [Pseudomonas graminis]
MDTVEELRGTYFYKGISNLSAGELFFWVFLDAVNDQLGTSDIAAAACIILGQPTRPTRGKFSGATKGTSIASEMARRHLNVELPFRLPTFTNASLRTLKPKFVNNLGAFVGRAVPVLGWIIIASDVATIAYRSTVNYNRIARGGDKIW